MSGFSSSGIWQQPYGMESPGRAAVPERVCIVTDSASDILPSHARAIGVTVVPTWVVMDGAVLRDGVDITSAQFYARLPHLRTLPHTEPPTPEEFYRTYQAAFQQGATGIVSIHISSRLSKNVEHATAARDYLYPNVIDVIDSQQVGIGLWPAVIRAAQLARMGAPVSAIHAAAVSILARTRLYALVESLDQLARNGRIGRARAWVGTLLDTHPLITIADGEVTPVETVRPRSRGLLRLRELAQEAGEIETLLVCGTSVESTGEIQSLLAEYYPGTIQQTWLGPAIGANTGPCIGVAVVTRH